MRHVVGTYRTPIGAVGEVGQDFIRASLFLGGPGRMTDENLVAGDCITRPLHIERTGNRNAAHAFEVRRHVVVPDSFNNTFLNQRIFQECRSKLSCAGLHRHADLEMRIGGRSAAEHDLFFAGRNGEQVEPLNIEPEIELAFPLEAQIFVVSAPLQGDRNLIFAVHREQVAHEGAAARAGRSGFAHSIELNEPMRNGIGLIGHGHRGIADGGPADLACRRKVPFQQYGRYLQHVSDVVEAVADVVGRQQFRDVNLQRQQITNGIPVLRSVEPMERGASRIGLNLRQAIAPGLDILDERIVGGCIGPRHAGRWHRAVAQLARQLLPSDAVGFEIGDVQGVQVQPCRWRGTPMTADAIFIQCRARGGRGRGGGILRRQCCRGKENRARECHAY